MVFKKEGSHTTENKIKQVVSLFFFLFYILIEKDHCMTRTSFNNSQSFPDPNMRIWIDQHT